jgi:outer membrane protein assembly factor BamB
MTNTIALSPETRQAWRSALSGLSLICGIFIATISLLLLFGAWHVQRLDPVQMPLLDHLQAQITAEPGNEKLKEQARQLDLVLRRDVFDFYAKKELGARFILAAGLVMVVAITALRRLRPPAESIDPTKTAQVWAAAPARLGIGATATLGCTALVLSAWTDRSLEPLKQAQINPNPPAVVAADADSQAPGSDIATAAAAELESQEVHWAAFRHVAGRGIDQAENPPTNLGDDHQLWSTALPKPGFASVIAVGDQVFTCGGDDDACFLYALNADSGELNWEVEIPAPSDNGELMVADSGYAAPTPCSDGKRIFANAVIGTVIATDLQGNMLWTRDLGTPTINYGYSSSLVHHNGKVFVQWDTDFGCKVLALDAENGETVWETERDVMASWASPIVTDTEPPVLVLIADPHLAGYNPETGEQLWKYEEIFGEVGPSPSYGAGIVVGCQDGSSLLAVDPVSGEQKWLNEDLDLPDTSSPLVTTTGRVYVPVTWGLLSCVDATSGEKLWEHEYDNSIWSSPIQVGELIYLCDRGGFLHVFKDSAEGYQEVASTSIDRDIVATPAIVDQRLYIRVGVDVMAFE